MNEMRCPLSQAAEKHPDAPAIISSNKLISFGQLEQLVHQASTNLKKAGVQRGTRVGLWAPVGPEYFILVLAAFRIGAVVCLFNDKWPEKSISREINRLGCNFLVTDFQLIETLPSESAKILSMSKMAPSDLEVSVFRAQPVVFLNNPAAIIFTSGSTQIPKAVLLSYGNFYYSALGANQKIKLESGDRWLLSLPLYHVGGLGVLFRSIISGGAVVIPQKNESIAAAVMEYGVTHLSVVPAQLARLLNSGQLELIDFRPTTLVGGAPISNELLLSAKKAGLKVFTTYGLTEMASQVTTGKLTNSISSGKVLKHCELKIAKDGEILVKGKTLFQGYASDDSLELPLDNQGWFHTGDIGALDAKGNLTVHGRKDNMFVSGGENIYPEEIESWLKTVDGIDDALVVGLEDSEYGHRPSAFVKFANENHVSTTEIISSLEKNLPRFKIPKAYFEWPKESGVDALKPNRREFEELAKDLSANRAPQSLKVSS